MTLDLAIETIELTKNYGTLTAVNKLNLKIERKTIHGFLGPNGAGKSTTIKMLMGLLRPSAGVIKILGQEVKGDSPQSRLKVGFMAELPKFPKHLKGSELLDIYGRMYGLSNQRRQEQIPRLIELVGLKGRDRDLIGRYSKGMQQRIGIAQALIGDPELVILDEPSIGLDPVGNVEVREIMKGIVREGRTVFLSSHLLFEVEQICNDITIIHHGNALVSDSLTNVSGMLHSQSDLNIEVSHLTDNIVEGVQSFPFVSKVNVEGNTVSMELTTSDDVRSVISQEVTRRGGIIVSMNTRGRNLEDVFLQLVSKSDGGKQI